MSRIPLVPQRLELLLLPAGKWTLFAGFLEGSGVPLGDGIASWPEGRAPAGTR